MFIVLGKNGYIGSAFVKYFEREEIPYLALSRGEVDYTDLNTLKEFLHKNKWNTSYNLWQTEGIINCAGFIGKPNVDACEDHKNETLLGNTHLPAGLAQLCGDMDIPFIHISSGCIFTGYDKQFSEQDAPNFTFDSGGSFYSGTKALAEQLIARTNKNSYIFRLRIPVAGVAKIIYPCNSLYIVESKSIKLYLNSFNMDRCGQDPYFVRQHIQKTVARDLSELLQTDVQVAIFPSFTPINGRPVFLTSNRVEENKWLSLEDVVTLNNVNVYKETPDLLKTVSSDESEVHKFHSALLKSNCKVTSQPDWGDIYITITGDKIPDQESLLRYIISFRDECHFHEEICETVYKRLHDIYSPRQLAVTCLYARRGGIDINPTRYSFSNLAPQALIDITTLHTKTIKQ